MTDWFDGGGAGSRVDVAALLDSEGGEGLDQVVAMGALLGLGLTSDGGALGVTITVDGRWRREYFRDPEELTNWVAEALPAVRSACEARSASGAQQGRPRRSRGL
jgi:hypothetical protein